MNVILDLDNTIICALEFDEYKSLVKDDVKYLDNNFDYADMDKSFRIYCRPYLEEFLEFVFKNYNVSVFTAASKDYALFIIEHIIKKKVPDAELDFVFHFYHTEISEAYYKSPKDLRLLWDKFPTNFREDNTVIIDDLSDVKKANQSNCMNIKAFELVDKENTVIRDAVNDRELLHMMEVLKLL